MKGGQGLLAGGLLLVLAAAGVGIAAPSSCTASCVRRMTACRAERCPGATGEARRDCRDVCRAVTGCAAGAARIRTLAAVVTECRSGPGGLTARQRLEIRHGDCPPVIVAEARGDVPVPDVLDLCSLYGRFRVGFASMPLGVFERLGVSPDGRTVFFELTDDFRLREVPAPALTFAAEEGLYVVRADGSGLRRLGPASREAPFRVTVSSTPPFFSSLIFNVASFSPNSRLVVYSDRRPGSDGSDGVQLVVLDTKTGRRTQLTTFTEASQTRNTQLRAFFVDDDTVIGYARETYDAAGRPGKLSAFTVKPDGTDFRPLVPPLLVPGIEIVQNFAIAGARGTVFTAALPRDTTTPFPGAVQELFIQQDARLLQLTNFGRAETSAGVLAGPGGRVFFAASADPFGLNRTHACQLFSVSQLGGDLRQLTRWTAPIPSRGGCFTFEEAPSCSGGVSVAHTIDPGTKALVTDSSCDPFGFGTIGDQAFALRLDGSGLRQLTTYRGMVVEPDGTVTVELPGPMSYSGLKNH